MTRRQEISTLKHKRDRNGALGSDDALRLRTLLDLLASRNEDRPDQHGEPIMFVDAAGVVVVVVAVNRGGYYGGVSKAAYVRDGFSCGARYYFGDDIAQLGVEVVAA